MNSDPIIYQENLQNIMEHYPNHSYVVSKEFKDNGETACAPVLNKIIAKRDLAKETSIFSTEDYAIGLVFHGSQIKIPYTDLKTKITKFFHRKWQQIWSTNNFSIKPNRGE